MPGIRKQVSIFLDMDQYHLLVRAAGRQRKPVTQLVRSFIPWAKVKKMALADEPDEQEAEVAA